MWHFFPLRTRWVVRSGWEPNAACMERETVISYGYLFKWEAECSVLVAWGYRQCEMFRFYIYLPASVLSYSLNNPAIIYFTLCSMSPWGYNVSPIIFYMYEPWGACVILLSAVIAIEKAALDYIAFSFLTLYFSIFFFYISEKMKMRDMLSETFALSINLMQVNATYFCFHQKSINTSWGVGWQSNVLNHCDICVMLNHCREYMKWSQEEEEWSL